MSSRALRSCPQFRRPLCSFHTNIGCLYTNICHLYSNLCSVITNICSLQYSQIYVPLSTHKNVPFSTHKYMFPSVLTNVCSLQYSRIHVPFSTHKYMFPSVLTNICSLPYSQIYVPFSTHKYMFPSVLTINCSLLAPAFKSLFCKTNTCSLHRVRAHYEADAPAGKKGASARKMGANFRKGHILFPRQKKCVFHAGLLP